MVNQLKHHLEEAGYETTQAAVGGVRLPERTRERTDKGTFRHEQVVCDDAELLQGEQPAPDNPAPENPPESGP
ncbi:hypothetical protein [Streptomyces sp. ALI-76-A]|uniref:hypothetical protein n=1 Tax=Streptomyces sp. ALI-76-A TaxID=3025736 RepID=UPI00256EFDE3|nr:hypothetical protein [Streptomyces sp. ALI-76-A]MDL5199577.1 hypothetical protein [Streptomyces sp. ALI-76-A]